MLQDDRACTPPLRVVLLTGGHGYQRDAYLSMFTGIAGLQLTHVEHGGSTASGNPIAWTRSEGPARIVYLQPGHGPETYASAQYRQLLGNALRYVARRP